MQDLTRIFLLRHGQTAWNAELRIQGQLDIPLDATGLWQAARVAEALRDEGVEAIYTSDLQRARQTAAPLAAACGLQPIADEGLRERSFGSFEGRTYAEIELQRPEEALRWRRRQPDFQPGGGEALRNFHARSIGTLLAIAAQSAGRTIAVVAHGGVLDCVYRAATRVDLQTPRTWQLANATINRLLWTEEGLSLVGWNDASHLDPAERNGDSER